MLGKTALITGGTRGIGREIALRLAREGANVAILYAGNRVTAEQTLEEIEALGVRALALVCDVSDYEQVKDSVAKVREMLGPIDILVNNAGITRDKLSMRMSPEDFDRVIQVNLNGAFHVIRATMTDFVRRRSGRIINIASIAGMMGNVGQVNYAASKAGMIGMTKSIARELASRGVTCNAIAPGFIRTDMTDAMQGDSLEKALKIVPVGRIGEAKEVAEAVAFLAGPNAGYITGTVLKVDGGLYM